MYLMMPFSRTVWNISWFTVVSLCSWMYSLGRPSNWIANKMS